MICDDKLLPEPDGTRKVNAIPDILNYNIVKREDTFPKYTFLLSHEDSCAFTYVHCVLNNPLKATGKEAKHHHSCFVAVRASF